MTHWESLSFAVQRLRDGTPPPPDAGLFGASINPLEARLVIIPVPWDATVSYGDGTSKTPLTIIPASHQLDLEDPAFGQPYTKGISLLAIPEDLIKLNEESRKQALFVIEGNGSDPEKSLAKVNLASEKINSYVESLASSHISQRFCGVLGGDHSSPYGLIKALTKKYPSFGILHFDAHFDLRSAYEGFQYSHASIMYNVMETLPEISQLIQVGIRDYSAEELSYQKELQDQKRGRAFLSRDLFRRKALGESWQSLCLDILSTLPEHVYISFDIDGLDPSYCPSTGTPVPGGLSFEEAMYLIEILVESGRKIVGFDLCEVAPAKESDWDLNVGARVLYKLSGSLIQSQS